MERLQKRSDGFFETPSGLLAVSPKRVLYESASYLQFNFKVKPLEPSIVVRWRKEDGIAVIDEEIAKTMHGLGYADHASEEQVERWNARVAELELDAPNPAGNEDEKTDPPQVIDPPKTDPAEEQKEGEQSAEEGNKETEENSETEKPEGDKKPEEGSTEDTEEQTEDAAASSGKKKKGSVI